MGIKLGYRQSNVVKALEQAKYKCLHTNLLQKEISSRDFSSLFRLVERGVIKKVNVSCNPDIHTRLEPHVLSDGRRIGLPKNLTKDEVARLSKRAVKHPRAFTLWLLPSKVVKALRTA